MRKWKFLLALFLVFGLIASGGSLTSAQEVAPSVTVSDQEVKDGTVTIAEVVAAQDGWLVIHAQKDGGIGPVIGHAPVTAGTNTDVVVTIDTDAATETLYAMLHIDAGEMGTYEFPGPDGPVVVDGAPLAPAFMVTMPAEVAPSVTVRDQEVKDGTVTIAEVVAAQD
ncbi:MAG: hypothetical protein D6790_00070, partial [Caldilineae bacterium]